MSAVNDPEFVLYDGDETKTEYPGYRMNGNGEFTKTGRMIDEDFTSSNEVWIISLNESVAAVGGIINDDGQAGGGTGGTGSLPADDALIDRFQIRCHKESFSQVLVRFI